MRVEFTHIIARFPRGYFLQWALFDTNEPGVYEVYVDRSGGPEGPWETIFGPLLDQYAVLDPLDQTPASLTYLPVNQLAFGDRVHYRVRVKSPSGEERSVVSDANARLPNPTPGAAKMLQHKRHLQLEFSKSLRYHGTPVALLKRRRWGARCPKCFDARTNKVMRADCRSCWGVGYDKGYWAPHYTQAIRSSLNSTVSPNEGKKAESASTNIFIPEYPVAEPDDVLVALEDQRRFLITGQGQQEIRLRGVFQALDASELGRDHVLFGLTVQPSTAPPLY